MIAWKKRPGGSMELSMPCESGRVGDSLEIEVDPLSPVTQLGPQATVSVTEHGAGADPYDGSPCEAVATVTLTAAGLRRLAAACGEAADELDKIGADGRGSDGVGRCARSPDAAGVGVGRGRTRRHVCAAGWMCGVSNEDEDKAAQRYPLWCVDAGSHRNEDRYRGPWPDKESALAGALDEWHEEDGDPKPTLRRCRRMLLSDVVGRAALGSYATHFVAEIDDDAAHEPENGMAWAHWEDSVLDTLEGFEDAMIAVLDRFVQTSVYVCEGDEQ